METESEVDEARVWKRDFGYRLRLQREAMGLSQSGLAHRAGLHPTYVSGVERGLRNISLVNINRIAVALGVPVTSMFCSAEASVGETGTSGC